MGAEVRRVVFNPETLAGPALARWKEIEVEAAQATDRLLADYKNGRPVDPEVDAEVWGKIKAFMLENVFDNKCAYCESNTAANSPQHAEHWRPKKGLSDPSVDPARRVRNETGRHPGYWWLAYAWENIVPACYYCNTGGGKGTKFPVGGQYVFQPIDGGNVDGLDEYEKPLLLHPFRGEHPEDHISFQSDGFAYAIDGSSLGMWTIEVLKLNREDLVAERRTALLFAELKFADQLSAMARGGKPQKAIMELVGPQCKYSRFLSCILTPRMEYIARSISGAPSRVL